MTALAQGSAGLALVMSFGLLGARQVSAAIVLLAVQGGAVAASALAQHQPAIAAAAIAVDVIAAIWLLRHAAPDFDSIAPPAGGVKLGIALGAALAVLCQSRGPLAEPLAIVLMSVLLAATRRHRLMHLIALAGLQNGLILTACLAAQGPLPALAGCLLAVPAATGIILDHPGRRGWVVPDWLQDRLGWGQVGLAGGVFAACLLLPLDPLATLFVPLIAAWGAARSWINRTGRLTLTRRLAAIKTVVFMLIAVSVAQPLVAWLAVLTALAAAVWPALRRRWDVLILGSCGAGVALFGLLTLPLGQASLSCTALFAGLTAIVAAVPGLGVIVALMILRMSVAAPWPPVAGMTLTGVAVAGLLSCAALLTLGIGRRATLLGLVQVGIAAAALGIGRPDARFAAMVLLVLLVLSGIAEQLARGAPRDHPGAAAAIAGLGCVPPLGVFPGLVLALLAIAGPAPWLLLPIGAGLAAALHASLPRRLQSATIWGPAAAAWLPLGLALLFGFCAPDGLVQWLRTITAGPS